jgi:polyisoprenyl-phosphate glycosyltransferase
VPHGEEFMIDEEIAIVIPVWDDWPAFQRLVGELGRVLGGLSPRIDVVAVDDGSNLECPADALRLPAAGPIRSVTVLRLALNLGHQRAIAVGLTEVAARPGLDSVVVMDGDGEDRPEDVPLLLAAGSETPEKVIVARRDRRSEGPRFKAGLWIYKRLFRLLAGQDIDFGNFSLLPIGAVRRLVYMSELWNNLPAAVMRSRLPYRPIATERGRRYAGRSKMNWAALVVHGLSALSVYSDVVFARLLVAAAGVAGVSLIGIAIAVIIRVATDLATPGWATTVVGVFLIVLIQIVVATIVASLALLGGRNRRLFVPKSDCPQFIAERRIVARREAPEYETVG